MNRTALAEPKLLAELEAASTALEEAQRRALEGDADGAGAWRAAAARERDAAQAVLAAAELGAAEAGHPATKQALDRADETLRAAAADPDLRKRLVSGRLEREQSGATLGALAPWTAPAKPRGRKRASAPGPAKAKAAKARRELARAERELATAAKRAERQRERVERAAATLREQEARLAELEEAEAEARGRVEALEAEAAG